MFSEIAESSSNELLTLLESKLSIGLWSYDAIERTFRWSAGMLALLGLAEAGTDRSRNLIDVLIHPRDRRADGEIAKLLQRGVAFEREFRIIQPSGRLRWLMNRGDIFLDPAGNPQKAVVVVIDTTAHREKEQLRALPYMRLRNFITVVSPLIWTARSDATLIQVLSAKDFAIPARAERSSTPWYAWVHPDDASRVEQSWSYAAETLSPFEVEHRFRQDIGHDVRFRTVARPVFLQGGAFEQGKTTRGEFKQWNGISVALDTIGRPSEPQPCSRALRAPQIRAARAILRWSVSELGAKSSLTSAVIRRLEESEAVHCRDAPLIEKLVVAFQDAGVEFIAVDGGETATRLRPADAARPSLVTPPERSR